MQGVCLTVMSKQGNLVEFQCINYMQKCVNFMQTGIASCKNSEMERTHQINPHLCKGFALKMCEMLASCKMCQLRAKIQNKYTHQSSPHLCKGFAIRFCLPGEESAYATTLQIECDTINMFLLHANKSRINTPTRAAPTYARGLLQSIVP